MITSLNNRLGSSVLRRSVLFGVGASLLAAPSLFAQTSAEPKKMERVVVTGSNIPTAETETATPVRIIDRERIEQLPVRNTSELLRRLTEANASGVAETGNATGFETGASGVSIRGFGAEATLVLLNGRRVTFYGDGQNGTDSFVDLNSIPLAIVDRVEILKDGASAIYGADAVAGVVNIITHKHYRGGEATVSYGNTTKTDAAETSASAIFGTGDDKTDVYASFNFFKRNALFNRDRPFSAVVDRRPLGGVNTGSRNSVPGVFFIPRTAATNQPGVVIVPGNPTGPGQIPDRGSDPGHTNAADSFYDFVAVSAGTGADWSGGPGSVPTSQWFYHNTRAKIQDTFPSEVPRFNFNQFSGVVPATERKGIYSEIEHKIIGDQLKVFGELMYQNIQTEEVLAPGPIADFEGQFPSPIVIPASSPWNPFGADISDGSSYRPIEFGNRVTVIDTDFLRFVGGVRGTVMDNWNYESAFLWNESRTIKEGAFASASKFSAVLDPANTPDLPYNPFVNLGHPLAANNAFDSDASVSLKDRTRTKLILGDLKVNNDQLFEIPMGAVGFATGIEFRKEQLDTSPDTFSSSGDVIGTSPLEEFHGARDVKAWYGELKIPLASPKNEIPGFYSFEFLVAGRYEDYSDAGSVAVPKISVAWQPIDKQLLLRGSWGLGFKAPSLFELLTPGNFALQILNNPYNGENGVEADINRIGNPNLAPEDSKSYNVGVVYSPDWLKGLTVHADFWQTERSGVVDSADFQVLLNQAFANNPNPLLANTAFPAGSGIDLDLRASGGINLLTAPFSNTSRQVAKGVDFGGIYQFDTSCGRFTYNLDVAYLHSWKGQDNASAPVDQLAGQPFSDASDAYVQWKGQTSLFWDHKEYAFGVTGNYIGSYDDTTLADLGFHREVEPYLTMDLQASVKLPYDFKVTVGCNNVFNADPPLTLAAQINAAVGYFKNIYNPLGRFVYAQVTKKF